TDGPAADVRLRDLLHFDRTLQTGVDAHFLQHGLHGHPIDHGCQHAHIISMRPLDTGVVLIHAAVDITPTDDNRHLHTHFRQALDLPCILFNDGGVHAET